MAVIVLDICDGDDPNGTALGTIDDSEAQIAFRVALNEMGSGEIRIPRGHAKAALLVPGRYVKVNVPSVDASPIFGFWLEDGAEDVLTADDPETLTIGGPGPLWVLRRGRLLEEIFAPGQTARGGAFQDDVWWWQQQPRGAILVRGIEEGQHQPGQPLQHVSIDFDRAEDSDGVSWPEINGEWQTGIGTDILELAQALKEDGGFIVQGRPNLLVQAHQTYGRDLTGASFGAGVVRITEENLATELARSMHARRGWTHVLVRGKDSTYVAVEKPGWTGVARWGFYTYDETNDEGLLEQVGLEQLRIGDVRRDALQLEITPGFNEAEGRYMPGPDGTDGHVWVGDTVSIDVGDEDRESVVVALRVETGDATDDTSDDTSARSLRIVLEFDAEAEDDGTATPGRLTGTTGSSGGHNHPPVPRLCRPVDFSSSLAVHRSFEVAGGINGMATVSGHCQAGDPADRVLYAWHLANTGAGVPVGADYQPTGNPSDAQAMTLIGSVTAGGSNHVNGTAAVLTLWRLVDPDEKSGGGAWITFSENDGVAAGSWLVVGADQGTPERDVTEATGNGSTSSVTPGTVQVGDLVLDVMGWCEWSIAGGGSTPSVTPDAASNQTVDQSGHFDNPTGQEDPSWGAGHSAGAGAREWDLNASKHWVAGAIVVKPGSLTGVGDGHANLIGTSIRVKRCDDTEHYHATADPTVNDDAMAGFRPMTWWFNETTTDSFLLLDNTAGAADWVLVASTRAASIAFDPTGTGLAATNLQDAIEELDTAAASQRATLPFIIDGGGAAITTGIKGDLGPLDFGCEIEAVTLLADQTGDIVVDIWADSYANYPPTDADSITASAEPEISGGDKSQDTTLTGWTTTISAGTILRYNVDSVADVTRVTVALKVRRT